MSFMEKEIKFGEYFAVETNVGLEIVPTDVIGRTVATHVEVLLNYLEGTPLDEEETCEVKSGWLAGPLRATWIAHRGLHSKLSVKRTNT